MTRHNLFQLHLLTDRLICYGNGPLKRQLRVAPSQQCRLIMSCLAWRRYYCIVHTGMEWKPPQLAYSKSHVG